MVVINTNEANNVRIYNVYEYNEHFIVSIVCHGYPEQFINQLFKSPAKVVKHVTNNPFEYPNFNPRYKSIYVANIGKKVLTFINYK